MVAFKQIQFCAICVKGPFGYNLLEEKKITQILSRLHPMHTYSLCLYRTLDIFFMLGCCRINTLVFRVYCIECVYRPFNESKVCLYLRAFFRKISVNRLDNSVRTYFSYKYEQKLLR